MQSILIRGGEKQFFDISKENVSKLAFSLVSFPALPEGETLLNFSEYLADIDLKIEIQRNKQTIHTIYNDKFAHYINVASRDYRFPDFDKLSKVVYYDFGNVLNLGDDLVIHVETDTRALSSELKFNLSTIQGIGVTEFYPTFERITLDNRQLDLTQDFGNQILQVYYHDPNAAKAKTFEISSDKMDLERLGESLIEDYDYTFVDKVDAYYDYPTPLIPRASKNYTHNSLKIRSKFNDDVVKHYFYVIRCYQNQSIISNYIAKTKEHEKTNWETTKKVVMSNK